MAPVQRDGIEYEFTVTADLDIDHRLMVGKTRCRPLSGKTYAAGHAAEMGQVLAAWLDEAPPAEAAEEPTPSAPPARQEQGSSPPAPAARQATTTGGKPARVGPSWVREFMAAADGIGASADERREIAALSSGGRTQSLSALYEAEAETATAHLQALAVELAKAAS